jgi:hypothetical protein
MIVVLGRTHALMMESNLPQLHFRLFKQLSSISTYLPLPTPINHHKKSCKQQLKMKFGIALRQNCVQSATVWW